jgi:hypothetical protein
MWRNVVIAAIIMAAVHAKLAIAGVVDAMPAGYGIVTASREWKNDVLEGRYRLISGDIAIPDLIM